MSKQWQIRRGTTVENDSFTGAQGELTMDTDKNQIRLHDGATQGGMPFGDTVVEWQAPTAENNYTWYRKYASGWVEQGGISDWKVTIALPKVMSDTNYCVQISGNMTTASTLGYPVDATNKTINGFYLGTRDTGSQQVAWQVSGMAA